MANPATMIPKQAQPKPDTRPTVEGGRWPVKRSLGDPVAVECDLVRDGHDLLPRRLRFRWWVRVPFVLHDRRLAFVLVSHKDGCSAQ